MATKNRLRERWSLLTVLALMIAYSAYFSALSIQRHNTFRTHASDLGQMDQALWNTLHGHWLEDTRPAGFQAPRLTDHVEPIFFIIPFSFLIYDGVEAILVLQSIAIALGALPIFWIARRRLQSDWAAVAFAAMYLLFPALQAANLAEFHAVTFAPAPLLLAYHYAEERAWNRFVLFSLIALAVKEEIALLVFALAAVEWFQVSGFKFQVRSMLKSSPSASSGCQLQPAELNTNQQNRLKPRLQIPRLTFHVLRFNLEPGTWNLELVKPALVAALSLAWFVVAVFVIVPHFSPAARSVYIGRYPEVSHDPIRFLASLPQWIASIFIPDKIRYVVTLLASAGFIALLDPVSLLIGLPSLMMNLLSNYPAMYSGTYHYSAPVAPYFVLAAIGGAAVVARWVARRLRLTPPRALALVVMPALAVALGYQVIAGYTPIGGEFFWPQTTPHDQLLARFLNQVPRDALVSTTSSLFPHLSHRRILYRFPLMNDAEYILLDVSQSITTNPVDYRLAFLDALKQGFGIRDAADGYILLQRGLAQKQLPEAFYNFLRAAKGVQPEQRVVVDFENKIRFLGFDVRQDDWQRVYLRTYWTRLPGMDENSYVLFPFYPDETGVPRADALLPDLLIPFWYPTSMWKEGEVIMADTLPIEMGARAKIGVGVFFGATWQEAEMRLAPHTTAPTPGEGVWALVGELVRNGKRYQGVSLPGSADP